MYIHIQINGKYRNMTFWVYLVLLVRIWFQDWPTSWYWITNWGVHPRGRLISLSQQSVLLKVRISHWTWSSLRHRKLPPLPLYPGITSMCHLHTSGDWTQFLTPAHDALCQMSELPSPTNGCSWRSKPESGISWGLILVAAAESRP